MPIHQSLKNWFLIHFIADLIFAIPLLFFPTTFLTMLGWITIDPLTSRLVGAALFGIGTASLLSRNASTETYKALLNLKILWSSAAILGLTLSIFSGSPKIAYLFLVIFIIFSATWSYYRWKIRAGQI